MSPDYRIFETKQFLRDLQDVPPEFRQKLYAHLKEHLYPALQRQPHFGSNIVKLRDWQPETWRYRVGRWRIFYEVDDIHHVVSLVALKPRPAAYRD